MRASRATSNAEALAIRPALQEPKNKTIFFFAPPWRAKSTTALSLIETDFIFGLYGLNSKLMGYEVFGRKNVRRSYGYDSPFSALQTFAPYRFFKLLSAIS